MSFPNSYEYLDLSLHLKYDIDNFEETLKGLKNIISHFQKEVEFWEQDHFINHGIFRNYSTFFKDKYDLLLNFHDTNKETDKDSLKRIWDNLSPSLKLNKLNINNRNASVLSCQTPTAIFF
ncbi:MAG: hypothetical protein ROO71_01105 [Balneola sp.]